MRVAPQVVGALRALRMDHPSSIQRLAIPALVRRWDPVQRMVYAPPTVALQDYTGSGKTYAYGVPILSNTDNYIDDKLLPAEVAAALNTLKGVPLPAPADDELGGVDGLGAGAALEYGSEFALTNMTEEEMRAAAVAADDVHVEVEFEEEGEGTGATGRD